MLRAQLGREGGRKESRCEHLVDAGSRELVWRLQATLAAIWTINSTMQSALKRPISDALAHLLTQEWTEREKLQKSKAMEYHVLREKGVLCRARTVPACISARRDSEGMAVAMT